MVDYNILQLIVGMVAIVFIVAFVIWVGIYYYNEYKLSKIYVVDEPCKIYVVDEPWKLCPWWHQQRNYKMNPLVEEEWCGAGSHPADGKYDCEKEECLLIKMYRMMFI